MESEQHSQLVRALKGPWLESSDFSASGEVISWTPVLSIQKLNDPWPGLNHIGTPVNLGLSSNGWWVKHSLGLKEQAVEYKPGSCCLFLFPLLEGRPTEIRPLLTKALVRLNLSAEWIDCFPFEELVIQALKSKSEYWTKLALGWAKELDQSNRLIQAVNIAQFDLEEIKREPDWTLE